MPNIPAYGDSIPLRRTACTLATIAVLAASFHFWPLPKSRAWELFSPSNAAVLLWLLLCVPMLFRRVHRKWIMETLPHQSVFAFLAVAALSLSFSSDMTRSLSVLLKQGLILVGAFSLFSHALRCSRSWSSPMILAFLAVTISVVACLIFRFAFHSSAFGFHGNPHKYGTFIAVLVPLSCVFLLLGHSLWLRILGMAIVAASLLSAGTLGTVLAIALSLIIVLILTFRRTGRWSMIVTCLLAVGTAGFSAMVSPGKFLLHDVLPAEMDGTNLKQRYIEWQAELNLLEMRPISGTGSGCLNDHRSEFYYRLPKLNTLNAFDQNGWLATAAELGLLGLFCLVWMIGHYSGLTWQALCEARANGDRNREQRSLAILAALIGGCIAHLFSSLFFNGILIAFAFVLALASEGTRAAREYDHA